MEPSTFDFRRKRDVGEVFGDTFSFLRDHFRPFGKALVYISLPALIAAAIASGMFMQRMMQFMAPNLESLESGMIPDMDGFFAGFSMSGFLLMILISVVAGLIMYGVVYVFIYNSSRGLSVEVPDIWAGVQERLVLLFSTYVGGGIILSILMIPTLVLVIIPCLGWIAFLILMLAVGSVFLLSFPIRFEENLGLVEALFTRSRQLLKGNWWTTIAVITLMYVVVVVVSFAVIFPIQMMTMGGAMWSVESADPSSFFGPAFIFNQIVSSFAGLLSVLPITAMYLQYFSLVAQEEESEA